MSIIAWDGTCIAADRRICNEDFAIAGSKLIEVMREGQRYIIGWTGMRSNGLLVAQWFQQGERAKDWPKCQIKEDWTLVVILDTQQRRISCYEYNPIALPLHPDNTFMAWGGGRDFAIGAMAAGKTAVEAVEIASRFCPSCGNGADVFYLNKELHNGSTLSLARFSPEPASHPGY